MATKYEKKQAIKKMLDNLSDGNFQRFRNELRDRENGPSVSQVEAKERFDIADLLVQFYTTDGAPGVAAEILREIKCKEAAELLEEKTGGPSSAPGPTAPSSAGPPAVADNGRTGEQFVDKERAELIKRAGDIDTMMDELLEEGHLC